MLVYSTSIFQRPKVLQRCYCMLARRQWKHLNGIRQQCLALLSRCEPDLYCRWVQDKVEANDTWNYCNSVVTLLGPHIKVIHNVIGQTRAWIWRVARWNLDATLGLKFNPLKKLLKIQSGSKTSRVWVKTSMFYTVTLIYFLSDLSWKRTVLMERAGARPLGQAHRKQFVQWERNKQENLRRNGTLSVTQGKDERGCQMRRQWVRPLYKVRWKIVQIKKEASLIDWSSTFFSKFLLILSSLCPIH